MKRDGKFELKQGTSSAQGLSVCAVDIIIMIIYNGNHYKWYGDLSCS